MHSPQNKNEKIVDTTTLTDYDLIELHIRCVEVFVETLSRMDLNQHRCFELGQVLWEKAIEARNKYRVGHPLEK